MEINTELLGSMNNKLSVIINLLMKKEEMSIKEKVALLENVPISYKEAAQILGISEKHYSKEKSLLKNNTNKNILKEEINAEKNAEGTSNG